ncbi:hypothetical protein [Streptomyces sedi]|uniref:Uncharacterized protein n=1 Tax=Streptomyces sedi TaxID=555059 RepID=A0A5C4V583_9ACTN|nr:hypothetical protein [Streptomyces sedi]TNM31104.1 hypothetical protein FH715_10460 [Streptomyces sedi]
MGLVQLVHGERPSVGRALRALDERLLAGGRRTALENARSAVREDEERAAAHRDAVRALRTVGAGDTSPALPTSGA